VLPVVAFINGGSPETFARRLAGFRAGLSEAGDKTKPNRVFADAEGDWDCRCRSLSRNRSWVAAGYGDDSHAAAKQIIQQSRQTIRLPRPQYATWRKLPQQWDCNIKS
jgi:hypothetical protein